MKDIKNHYDDTEFYKEYSEMRKTKLNANELIEIPMIKSMLPNLMNKTILDLGIDESNIVEYKIGNDININDNKAI